MTSTAKRQIDPDPPRPSRRQYDGQVAAQALDLLRREKMARKVSVISAA